MSILKLTLLLKPIQIGNAYFRKRIFTSPQAAYGIADDIGRIRQ